ncbi:MULTISPECIES: DUF2835 family protein [Gammaproteobacteria]|uniref:DUF2835 family protein n=1 Tax=Gammaproteobacteria TaxID=1236 RepID=UPI000DD04040|nr:MULTISPECIES: DUF2835 family protein [Gammaproteobacteria]RTE87214.1 DUF2835 family protein [Aliidiomarina sp. B3213]TCZ92998.1 DUF2835 family protein [Lysobacter sp. N42]
MHEYYFSIVMSALDVEHYYYGQGGNSVVITAENGLRLQLAIRHMVPFISRNGIRGRFKLCTDQNHKFVSLEKIRDF